MWLFAALIVLAMGGVAMLAAGHGAPLEEGRGDTRVSPEVPTDRPLCAADLWRARFSVAFRGYRMSEVDALLVRLASEKEARAASEPGEVSENDPSA